MPITELRTDSIVSFRYIFNLEILHESNEEDKKAGNLLKMTPNKRYQRAATQMPLCFQNINTEQLIKTNNKCFSSNFTANIIK